jgi:hypothetical protein
MAEDYEAKIGCYMKVIKTQCSRLSYSSSTHRSPLPSNHEHNIQKVSPCLDTIQIKMRFSPVIALLAGGVLARTPAGFSPSTDATFGVKYGDVSVSNGNSVAIDGNETPISRHCFVCY